MASAQDQDRSQWKAAKAPAATPSAQPTLTTTLTYDYDVNGNVTRIHTIEDGDLTDVYYAWDALNRLTNVSDARFSRTIDQGDKTAYSYDALGNQNDVAYPNGVKTTYTYDEINRLTAVTTLKGSDARASFGYTLGLSGQRTTVNETIGIMSRIITYNYDHLFRLTKEIITGASPTGTIDYGPQAGSETTTGYDNVGNRRSRQVSLSPAVSGLASTVSTYSDNDLLAPSSNFDADGNTLLGTVTPAQTAPDVYDFENRLVQRTITGYTNKLFYDGDGNRVRKEVTDNSSPPNVTITFYVVEDRNPTGYAQVLEEYVVDGFGQYVNGVSRGYAYGHALISLWQPEAKTLQYYGFDGHGNIRYLTDGTRDTSGQCGPNCGQITDTYTYDAFGILIDQEVRNSSGVLVPVGSTGAPAPTANIYLYCGEQWDPDLGLSYNRARYLNPNTGRFWTMDTFEGQQSDALSLHKYLYADGNPVSFCDPTGKSLLVEEEASASIRLILVTAILVAIPPAAQIYSSYKGSPPTPAQSARIRSALGVLHSANIPAALQSYVTALDSTKFRIIKADSASALGEEYIARTAPFTSFQNVVWINENYLDVDDKLLSATFMHEAAHLKHGLFEMFYTEGSAYQAESDYLRSISVVGNEIEVGAQFPG